MKMKITFTIMLLLSVAFVPAVNAQEENNYSVTSEEAIEHANAHMIKSITIDSQFFEKWKGASIDPKPLEVYDINGKKLYYQFSVYKNNNIIGKIDIGADKSLGRSVQLVEFDPIPFKTAEAMEKSVEIAKNNYPSGVIESTKPVVYDYPEIGAMTVVKDKCTGDEHRIFVDAYTIEMVPDKPATETQRGVCSTYEQRLKNGIDNNLNDWRESDNLTKSIKQEAINKGINISVPVSEENIKKFSKNAAMVTTGFEKYLSVPRYGQEYNNYCAAASGKMISAYYGVTSYTQTQIFNTMGGDPSGCTLSGQLNFYKSAQSSGGLGKSGSTLVTSGFSFNNAVSEIGYNRPFKSGTNTHARVCNGYTTVPGNFLSIDDPLPVGSTSGSSYMEAYGSEGNRIYVRS